MITHHPNRHLHGNVKPQPTPPAFQGQTSIHLSQGETTKHTPNRTLPGLETRVSMPQLRFSGIHNDYGIDLRSRTWVNAPTVSQVQRALLHRNILKGKEQGTLKMLVGQTEADWPRGDTLADATAMGDIFTLIPRPVDVIIRSVSYPDTLKTLLMATGKRYMYPDARLQMGPSMYEIRYKKDGEHQVNRKLYNDYLRDWEFLLMEKAGFDINPRNRQRVASDMDSSVEMSSLECLYYGNNGLVDALITGPDQVVTRQDLNQYIKANQLNGQELREFLAYGGNARDVAKTHATPLTEYSPESVKTAHHSSYRSLADFDKKPAQLNRSRRVATKEKKPAFHMFDADKAEDYLDNVKQTDAINKVTNLPLRARIGYLPPWSRIMIENVSPSTRSILDDDVIFYNDPFMDEVTELTVKYLQELDDKKKVLKTSGKKISNIKLMVNSPGGETGASREIRNTILDDLETPVDIIVTGMAASCGAELLCSASGNRLATPLARVMIHEAGMGMPATHGRQFNEISDGLHQDTMDYFDLVSRATDRPFDEVVEDYRNDVWFNTIESLYYGDKGLLDGILVSPSQAITRKDVTSYLLEHYFEDMDELNEYITTRLEEKRDVAFRKQWRPREHSNDDPFDNPMLTIHGTVAHLKEKKRSQRMSLAQQFPESVPPARNRVIDHYTVIRVPEEEEFESEASAKRKHVKRTGHTGIQTRRR